MVSKLEKYYNIQSIGGYENIFFSEDKFSSYTYIFTIINGMIIKVQQKDCKDFEKFVHDCMEIFTIITNHNIKEVEIRKIPLQRSVSNFTSIILIPYELCNHNPINEDIVRKTILVAPIYDCEFSGDENSEEVKAMITLPYATVRLDNWEREVSPKIKMAYANLTLQSHSLNKTFKLTKAENLFWSIHALKDGGSYIGFENYKHEKYLISWNNGKYSIIPYMKSFEEDLDTTIHQILLGENRYPDRLTVSDKINIEAVEANSSNLKRIIKSNYETFILKRISNINIIHGKNTLYLIDSEKKKIGIVKYLLTPLNLYKNNGCCYRITLQAGVGNCRITEILMKIGLIEDSLLSLCFNETSQDFHIAHGIYRDILSITELTVSLIYRINNLVCNKMQVIKEIEEIPQFYNFPTILSLIILFLNNQFSDSLIEQVFQKALDNKYSDFTIAKEKLSEIKQLWEGNL